MVTEKTEQSAVRGPVPGSLDWLARIQASARSIVVAGTDGREVTLAELAPEDQARWIAAAVHERRPIAAIDGVRWDPECVPLSLRGAGMYSGGRLLDVNARGVTYEEEQAAVREGLIPGGCEAEIVVPFQFPLRPIRFCVADHSAPHFEILSFHAGCEPLLATPAPIHATAFPMRHEPVGDVHPLPWANVPPVMITPGIQLRLRVRSLCVYFPIRFDAFLYCDAPLRRAQREADAAEHARFAARPRVGGASR